MIPKIIHYCWFGNNPIPKLEQKCIKSWKKHCQDYQFIKWDETNFDINSFEFTREAYKAGKWAFVADFVRLYALTKFGGIYLDTDIELLKSLDNLLIYKGFSGFENDKLIAAGIMGCEAENGLFSKFYDHYLNSSFKFKDGSIRMLTIPSILTGVCAKIGFKITNKFQEVEGVAIFPSEYFYPKDYGTGLVNITENTISIHHYSCSWLEKKTRKKYMKSWRRNKRKNFYVKLFGIKLFNFFNRILRKKHSQ